MALTQSHELSIGTKAPEFSLLSTNGDMVSLKNFEGARALVVMFICNHCPYVIHIAPALAKLAQDYKERCVEFVGINSNDVTAYPADSYEKMREEVVKRSYIFPYLLDETQSVAKAYRAACTPDIYVFDQDLRLFYHGQFDATRPHRIASGQYDSAQTPATGNDLKYALDCLLNNKNYDAKTYPCIGCNIKWQA